MYAVLLPQAALSKHHEGYPLALVEMESPNEEHDWETTRYVVSLPDGPHYPPARTREFGLL